MSQSIEDKADALYETFVNGNRKDFRDGVFGTKRTASRQRRMINRLLFIGMPAETIMDQREYFHRERNR